MGKASTDEEEETQDQSSASGSASVGSASVGSGLEMMSKACFSGDGMHFESCVVEITGKH